MNAQKLKDLLNKKGIKHEEMARCLNISRTAFYRKMRGATEFKQSEIMGIIKVLKLEDDDIHEFF